MYIDLNKNEMCYDDQCCQGEYCDDIEACGDIYGATSVDAAIKSKFDSIRKLLGEDEWYYIEEYVMNGDGKYSLNELLHDEDAWDYYCNWKMKNFGKKAALSAAKRIKARKILASKVF